MLEFDSTLNFFLRNLARPWSEFQFLLMSTLWMVLEIGSPSLVICYEENKIILYFAFAYFSLGYVVFSHK